MKNYKKLLTDEAYDLTLEEFKNISFVECEKNLKFFSYLCFYEKTEIVKYCLSHEKYKRLIEEKKLLNDYCVSISLEKSNTELIDYWLEKKLITKKDILKSIDGFFLGNISEKYLPEIDLNNVSTIGNKAIYHVKEKGLLLAMKNGFSQKDIDIESVYFAIKNHVDLKEKNNVLQILKEQFDMEDLFSRNKESFNKNKEEINSDIQCFELIIEMIFSKMNIKELFENHFWTVLNLIKAEEKNKTNYLKNKVLLQYSKDFSQEDLQKIKKFNKDFFREIEKVRLYRDFQEKPTVSNFSEKKLKI